MTAEAAFAAPPPSSLYERVLGRSAFESLDPVLQRLHDGEACKRYVGRASIDGGHSRLARAAAWAARLPAPCADTPVEVTIEYVGGAEIWTRRFGGHAMRSRIRARRGQLVERLGLLTLTFDLIAERSRIEWVLRKVSCFGLPLPRVCMSRCTAVERLESGRYTFDVRGDLLGVGMVAQYRGWLAEHDGAMPDGA